MPRRRFAPHLLAIAAVTLAVSAVPPTTGDVAAADPGGVAWSTSCDAEAAGYQPVRGLDLPTAANWQETTPPYAFDRSATVATGYDRVGYCLELTTDEDTSWVWTSMETLGTGTADLELPTRPGQIQQRYVDDLTVRSNASGVTSLDGGSGWVEMWPYEYGPSGTRQVPGASDDTYDADDSVQPSMGYGSFQVHAFADEQASRGPRPADSATATPVLTVNAFTADRTMDVGIGTGTAANPDWTFAGNAGDFTARRLTFYARPAQVQVDSFPDSRQVIPRVGQTDPAVAVTVSGTALDPDVTSVELRTTRDGRQTTERADVVESRFSITTTVPVALTSTDFDLWAETADGDSRRIARAVDVVAGDVYIVHGQSNAAANSYDGSAEADRSRWVRTFGTPHYDPDISVGTDGWTYGQGDLSYRPGTLGQWATRMGSVVSADRGVPLAIVNGARGGRRIAYFVRNDAEPTDASTDYGRLLQRLTRAGLAGPGVIDAMLWYQGETDANDADSHVAGFTDLVGDWRQDLDTDLRIYAHQVRYSPCNNAEEVLLRDAQRRLPDSIDNLSVLSTTALNATVSCHFAYVGGYRTLGDHNAATVLADLYGQDRPGLNPPDPRMVHRADENPRELVVAMRSPVDPLTVEDGAAVDFRVTGATVESVRWQRGRGLVLGLDRPALPGAVVSYHSHVGAGPRVMTSAGVGLLAFRVPVQ